MIQLFKVAMSRSAIENVAEVLASGMIGEGPKVQEFKERLERLFGCTNLLPLNSGTSALTLALRLANVEGGEVITTPFTMIATTCAIKAANATPIFADINPDNVNISIRGIKDKITPATRAIMVTHVGGVPCEMEKITELGFPVISDAAHAISTYYRGKHISHWAGFTAFSFQSIKQFTTGDGGALVVVNDALYHKAEKLKWFGMTRQVPEGMTRLQHQMTADVEDWGYKYHMNDIAAAIGLGNLNILKGIVMKQVANATYLRNELEGIVTIPTVPADSLPSWWSALCIFVEDRDRFISEMTRREIETTPMWRRNDEYSAFKNTDIILPNMTELQNKIVFIPCGWWLNLGHLEEIVRKIKEAQL